jgi:CRP/FNR family transcriptional regulator, cyclic AMP receptor protein
MRLGGRGLAVVRRGDTLSVKCATLRCVEWELLRGVPAEDVRRLLEVARRRTFSRGEVVFHEGDPADSLHLVAKGRFAVRVRTPLGDEAVLALCGPGQAFGELALVSGGDAIRAATVESIEAGETHAVYRREFERLRTDHPGVTDVLVAILAEQVRQRDALLLDAYYAPAEKRVLRRLRDVASMYADGVVRLTQDDLASLAGTSRATVNRVLREEERRGTVALERGRCTVLDPDGLARRAR